MVSKEDYDSFYEYLHKGVMLLDFEEFDKFHFEVDINDSNFKELATLIISQDLNNKNYFKNIEPKASNLLKSIFTPTIAKNVYSILEALEAQNSTNKELYTTIFASKLFLEDKSAEHYRLPLVITRLLEDVYMAFTESQEDLINGKET